MSAKRKTNSSGPVYSTEHGRMCPECSRPIDGCSCSKRRAAPTGDGVVRISKQTKGRKGKGVTLISGVPLPADQLKALGKTLKKLCGSGGTIKDGIIEIQGDHREKLLPALAAYGWTVKRSGG